MSGYKEGVCRKLPKCKFSNIVSFEICFDVVWSKSLRNQTEVLVFVPGWVKGVKRFNANLFFLFFDLIFLNLNLLYR